DAATGELVWKTELASVYTQFPQSGTPAVVDGRLYVLGAGRMARCLDAQSGQELWHTRLPGEFKDQFQDSSFAVADGVAVVLAGKLTGFNATTGKILWQTDDPPADLHSSPIVRESQGKRSFIAHISNKEIICVTPRTG